MARNQISLLPQGFVLDEEEKKITETAAALPEGFEIDQQPTAEAAVVDTPEIDPVQAIKENLVPIVNDPLPAGLPEEMKDFKPELPDFAELPQGFKLDDQISEAPAVEAPKGAQRLFPFLNDKNVKELFGKPIEQRQAEAANIYAIHKSTDLPVSFIEKNYDKIKKDSSITGLSHQIDSAPELAMAAGAPFMVAGAVMAPVATAAGLAGFTLLDHAIDLKKFVPSDASDGVKSAVELVDFIAKGAALHGVSKMAPKAIEAFTKAKVEQYNLPKEVKLSGEQIRDIHQTGKLTTNEEKEMLAGLNLSREAYKNALRDGVDIAIPTEKITTIADKPWFGKVKEFFGQKSQADVSRETLGDPKAVAGALPAPEIPVKPTSGQAVPSLKEPSQTTPIPSGADAGAAKPPAIIEAEKHGTVVGLDSATKLPIIDTSKPVKQPEAAPVDLALPADPGGKKITPPSIPSFKNTEEALAFGQANKDKPEVIAELDRLNDESTVKHEAILNKKDRTDFDLQESVNEATRGQLYREAAESARGEINTYQPKKVSNEQQIANADAGKAIEKEEVKTVVEDGGNAPSRNANDEGKQILTSVNPSGSIFSKYTPDVRASVKLGDNITTLDKTMGKSPDDIIVIYRGAPNNQKDIVAGDYITTNEKLAKDYAGTGIVLKKNVKLSEILDDKTESLGEEYIYRPSTLEAINGKEKEINQVAKVPEGKGVKTGEPGKISVDESKKQFQLNETDVPAVQKQANDLLDKGDLTVKDNQIKFTKPATNPKEFAARVDQLNKFAQAHAILRKGAKSDKWAGLFQGRGGKDAGKPGMVKLDQATLLNDAAYVSTLAHELGHALEHNVVGRTNDAQLRLFGDKHDEKTITTLYHELAKVTEDLVGKQIMLAKPEYYMKPAELVARFLEKMIASPGNLETLAPTAVKMFEAQAEKHPMIEEFIGVAEGSLYGKKDLPKNLLGADLRETYQKELQSKRLGNIAFGDYVSYRAMRERGKITIERFMNDKFKKLKDKPEDLFVAAEGIKVSKLGVPEFGTRSYITAKTPAEEVSLKAEGWEKTPAVIYEDGIPYNQYAKWNYTPADAKLSFDKLSPEGKSLVLDFTAQRSEAKDYFNREMIQSANNIQHTLEGWVHHTWVGESSSTAVGGPRFKSKVAGTRKQRTGAEGYVKDLNLAITKALTDLDGEKVWNDFIQRFLARVTRPLAEGAKPIKGWVEVVGDLKTGVGRPAERPKVMVVDSATGESFKMKQTRYQMPQEIYKHYELIKDLANEASLPLKIVNNLNKYWTINTLFDAGTATTNFIGGGVMYANKILHDMYLEGLTGDFKMPQTRANIGAMFKVLIPHGWAKAPDWVYGGDLSNFYGQFMSKGIDPVGNVIDKAGDKALILYSGIERYWKKAIITSENLGDVNKLGTMTKEGLALPTKEEREMLASVNELVDLYAMDYDNVPGWMEQWRRNPVARGIKPYATYPYKYMKHVEKMIRSVFDRSRTWQDRTATLLALSTIVAGFAYFASERKKRQQTPIVGVESKIPGRLQTRGRTFVGTDENGKELFTRFNKYPYLGLTQVGMELSSGNMEAGSDAITDMIGSLGPFANMAAYGVLGLSNKYNQYDSRAVKMGTVLSSYIPAYRVLDEIARYNDPYQRKQSTFGQTFTKYIPTTDADLQKKFHGEIRTEDVPVEGEIKGGSGRKTTVEYPLVNNKEDILRGALAGIYTSRIDPKIVEAYLIREEKNKKKNEEKLK